MASTKSPGIDWPRLGAESAIIIASILLALGVDEWRQERVDRELEAEYLGRLVDDLDVNLRMSTGHIEVESNKVDFARKVYPLVRDGEWAELDASAVVVAAYYATPINVPEWVDDTFDELATTGNLGLIQNIEIRQTLLAYYRYVEEQDWTYEFMSTEYREAVRSRMDPDLQLAIRDGCARQPKETCQFDTTGFEVNDFLNWMTSNQDLTEALNRVIVQYSRAAKDYLPEAQRRTNELKQLIEAELSQ
jgi:hypothetical protein